MFKVGEESESVEAERNKKTGSRLNRLPYKPIQYR
jgi:hypothetical protein